MVAEPNRGVEYRYIYPLDQASSVLAATTGESGRQEPANGSDDPEDAHRPRHGAKYSWTLKTLTVCSRSCGGGYQTTVAVCIKAPLGKVVPDQRCSANARPVAQTLRCNRSPCPARWSPGPWGPCSATCSDSGSGMQERRFTCRQELSPTMSIPVAERACLEPQPQGTEVRRRCLATSPCPPAAGGVAAADMPAVMEQPEAASLPRSTRWGRLRVEAESTQQRSSSSNSSSGSLLGDVFPTGVARRWGEAAAAEQAANNGGGGGTEWVAQPWGPCSVTCGAGIRERRVGRFNVFLYLLKIPVLYVIL